MKIVNVIPHHSNGQTDDTIPHKLYQYMMTRNAVIVNSSDPFKRVVSTTNSGLVFEAGNAQDFAQKVMDAYNDKNMLIKLGKNGHEETINKKLNWECTSRKLVELYQSIFKKDN